MNLLSSYCVSHHEHQMPERVLVHLNSRTVVMEVEIC